MAIASSQDEHYRFLFADGLFDENHGHPSEFWRMQFLDGYCRLRILQRDEEDLDGEGGEDVYLGRIGNGEVPWSGICR